MSLKHRIHRLLDFLTRLVFRSSRKMPTYFNGAWIWPSRSSWTSIYWSYEPHMARAIKAQLSRGATFWDVGANVGWFSLFAAKVVGPTGHVIAFEPSPDVFDLLRRNVEGCDTIKVFQYGIGNADATASFAMLGASSSSFIAAVTEINRAYLPDQSIQHVRVAMRRIDTVLNETSQPPDLVKIDVEGFECEVLKGAARLLSSCRPWLLVEIHPPQIALSGGSEDEVFELLRRHRYRWSIIDRKLPLYTIFAEPMDGAGELGA